MGVRLQKKITLVYFDGCPNAVTVRGELKSFGLEFVEVRQDLLPSGDRFLGYSSPTVLCDEQVVFGSEALGGSTCTYSKAADLTRLRTLLSSTCGCKPIDQGDPIHRQ